MSQSVNMLISMCFIKKKARNCAQNGPFALKFERFERGIERVGAGAARFFLEKRGGRTDWGFTLLHGCCGLFVRDIP